MTDGAINLQDKLARFSEHWSPRVIAEMNDYQFKLVKLQGEFVWHAHADTDEVFIVLQGAMTLEFRDKAVPLAAGEMYVVPKGVEHARWPSRNAASCWSSHAAWSTPAMPVAPIPHRMTCGCSAPRGSFQ